MDDGWDFKNYVLGFLFYRFISEKCLYAGYLIRYRLNNEMALPNYLFHYTHSTNYNNWVKSSLAIGAQPNISA